MLDKSIINLVKEASAAIVLREALIEKDYYVSLILSILSEIQDEHSSLVFAGRTCLAKAHHIERLGGQVVRYEIENPPISYLTT
jgi:predicted nucleotidyltransferase component of viral defense system